MPALPAAERARLEAAYRATTYRIHAPRGDIDLRIGEASPALAALLHEAGADCWAIISACNPRSIHRDDATNSAAQSELTDCIALSGHRGLSGENVADDSNWLPEASCCVFGMTAARAREYGKRFAQHAVVVGGDTGIPQLLWCGDD